MKKLFYTLACVFSIMSLVPADVSAEIYFPKTISIGEASSYDAGVEVKINSVDGDESIGGMTDIEYGVAQTYIEGYSTSYGIVSTQSKSLKDVTSLQDISLVIPNMYENTGADRYVVYVKYFEKNNPDKKKFFFTDGFGINKNNTLFTRIQNIKLLHSNGKVFPLLYGPTIYSPDYVNKNTDEDLATSTSLSISFESNQNVVAKPIITFSRLRSDSTEEVVQSEVLQVKKGETDITIPLPTFEYVPGVYVGKITFTEDFIKNDLNFQYIIGGGSVTVGIVEVVEKDNVLKFNIFDTPIDLERSYESADSVLSSSSMYTVSGVFIDAKGKESGNFIKEVDFTKENFTVDVPKKTFFDTEIRDIQIKVISKDGVVVFESTKKVQYTQKAKIKLINSIVYLLLFILLLIALAKKSIKLATIFIIVILLVSLGMYYKIQGFTNIPTPVSDVRVQGGHGIGKVVMLTTEDDLYTKKFPCGEPIEIHYEFKLQTCNNLPSTGAYDISFAGKPAATKNTGRVKLTGMDLGVATLNYPASVVPPTLLANTALTVHTHVANSNPRKYVDIVASKLTYNIPLQNTCAETPPKCLCSGRDEVCTLAGTEVSRTANVTSCALKASCSVSVSGTNATFKTIGTGVLGELTYKDTDTGLAITNPYTKSGSVGATIVQKTTITDGFDGKTANSVCSIEIPTTPTTPTTTVCEPNTPGCTSVGTVCTPGTPGCSGGPVCTGPGCPAIPVQPKKNPRINIFTPAKTPVRKGESCIYSWTTEDVDRCTVSVNGVNMSLKGDSRKGPLSVITDGNNQRAILTCVSDDDGQNSTISTTTLCGVLPEVIER